MVAERSVYLG